MKKKIGIIFISLFCFAAVTVLLFSANETLASDTREITCVVGDANYDENFDVADLVRLKSYLGEASTECSMDGDLDVSGDLAAADLARCREMLVGDDSLKVSVTEDNWYKKLKDTDGYYAYYKLNKSLQEGWILTFKIDFKENIDCSVYVYYPGCEEWIAIGEQTDGVYRLIAEEDIEYLNIRVSNQDNQTTVSDFLVYDIQVYKSAQSQLDKTAQTVEVDDMVITYNQTTDMPVVYGKSDTLDMTKFGVQTSAENLSYTWTLKQTNVSGTQTTVDMTSTAHTFSATGNYTLTANVSTSGYSGSVSTKIMVVNPTIYIGFDGGVITNTGTASNTVGAYTMNEVKSATCFEEYAGTVPYGTGIDGDADGAIVTTHYDGPYTVVKDYDFGTSNFTVSAWINVPNDITLSTGSTTYLFGTMNPDGTDGFAVSLKNGELRVKVLDKSANMPAITCERDSWYNVTVKRDGTSFKFYFDSELVKEYTIASADTFGTKDLAFGAYHGFGDKAYQDTAIRYDDIQVYSGALGDATIATLAGTDSVGADVVINYNNGDNAGKFRNSGMNSSITAKATKLSATKGTDTTFVDYEDTITYGTGAHGENNGAILTNHMNGPYTVTDAYSFNSDDFTVSTWFKIPNGEPMSKSGTYIFGTANPDATAGFSVCIKYENVYTLRLRYGGTTRFTGSIDLEFDKWNHIALCRDDGYLRIYLNGELQPFIQSNVSYNQLSTSLNFETAVLSVGGYTGWSNAYKDADMYFDDVRIYGSAVATKYIKEVYDNACDPQVYINYTDSTVANTGANTDIEVGTYKADATSYGTMFNAERSVPFTVGAGYDENGAVSVNHYKGTYTVVRDYVFGADDFSVSAWIKIPDLENLSTGAGTYLFGSDHINTEDGFAVSLKKDLLRIRLAGTTWFTNDSEKEISFKEGQWYHVALVREGANVKVYFDGELIDTKSDVISEDYDFGTADLAFGGYYGDGALKNANTHFDEVKVYNGALSATEIASAAETDLGSEEWTLNGDYIIDESTTIQNTDLFYTNSRSVSGADPGCIYVTEGEYAGYYIAYIGFKGSTQVKCYKSKDLVSWTTADSDKSRCFDPLSASNTWLASAAPDIWAPEVYYEDGTYYLFYSATSSTTGMKCLGLATSDSPIGPFTDIGQPLFDGTTLASENKSFTAAGFIDAHPFVDPETSNKYVYMARNREGEHDTNIISVVRVSDDWKTPDYSTYAELTTVNKTTYNGDVDTERSETSTSGSINEAPQVVYYNGTYYLTMSICGTTEADYAVIQAIGDSPTGPFTKIQESKGGVILGVDLASEYKWDHISCAGSHSFVQAGDEWFVLYHTHTDPTAIGDGYTRSLAVERMTWTTNEDGQTIMKSVGPTSSVQPKPASYSGYVNIASKANVTATNVAEGSDASYLNDGLVRILSNDYTPQFEGSGDVTITMTFDQLVKAKSLLIYNSWKYADAFETVSSVTFKYVETVDGVSRIGTKTVNNISLDMTTYSYANSNGYTVMIPGSPLVLTLASELEILEIEIVIPCADGNSSVAISDIALLGKALEETADVQVSYDNGNMSYTSSDDAVTVNASKLSGNNKDASSVFEDYTGTFEFTTGVAEDDNGAIVINHGAGPYTVVNDYNFGSEDFTISTWFKIPEQEIGSSGNYLFGIDNPDGTTGFSACIKYTGDNGYQLRFRILSKTLSMYNLTNAPFDQWYHLTLSRTGDTYNWYLDGELIVTYTTTSSADFGSTTFSIGAYKGWAKGSYRDDTMCFDELRIYGSALSDAKIAALTAEYKN